MTSKNLFLLFLMLTFVSCTGYRPPPVTKADVGRHAVYTVFHVIDWRQTRQIAKDPRYYELNPYLGEHPSTDKVDSYFVGTWIGMTGLTYLLPRGWREGLQYLGIVVEGGCVGYNFSIGLNGEW